VKKRWKKLGSICSATDGYCIHADERCRRLSLVIVEANNVTGSGQVRFRAPRAGPNTAMLGMPIAVHEWTAADHEHVVSSGANLRGLNLPISNGVIYHLLNARNRRSCTHSIGCPNGQALAGRLLRRCGPQGQVTPQGGYIGLTSTSATPLTRRRVLH
jgi:hypothetical protein